MAQLAAAKEIILAVQVRHWDHRSMVRRCILSLCFFPRHGGTSQNSRMDGLREARLLANPSPFTHNSLADREPVAVVRAFSVQRVQGGFMSAVRLRGFHLGLTLAAALVFSMLLTEGHAYTPEEQQACSGDAFRLCGPEIPDVDRITACMIRNQSQLSPECRMFFRAEPELEAARVTTKPLNIGPKPRKSERPRKSDSSD